MTFETLCLGEDRILLMTGYLNFNKGFSIGAVRERIGTVYSPDHRFLFFNLAVPKAAPMQVHYIKGGSSVVT